MTALAQPLDAASDLPAAAFLREVRGARVVVTGHTGFKGAWLAAWLQRAGAAVTGIALAPAEGAASLFARSRLSEVIDSHLIDLRDVDALRAVIHPVDPDFVFHLAAQSLVAEGYRAPLDTFASNIMGTANLLETLRDLKRLRGAVIVTTDKVYRDTGHGAPHHEGDELGGADPYAASKACAELVTACYAAAFQRDFGLATARGGNVVGGGDRAANRIIPDIVRAIEGGRPLVLRRPKAVRPWQHVLDLLQGYLALMQIISHKGGTAKGAPDLPSPVFLNYNFGPEPSAELEVDTLVARFLDAFGVATHPVIVETSAMHETHVLRLDATKARRDLGWRPLLDINATIDWTARFYRDDRVSPDMARHTLETQVAAYESLMLARPASPLAAG